MVIQKRTLKFHGNFPLFFSMAILVGIHVVQAVAVVHRVHAAQAVHHHADDDDRNAEHYGKQPPGRVPNRLTEETWHAQCNQALLYESDSLGRRYLPNASLSEALKLKHEPKSGAAHDINNLSYHLQFPIIKQNK